MQDSSLSPETALYAPPPNLRHLQEVKDCCWRNQTKQVNPHCMHKSSTMDTNCGPEKPWIHEKAIL